MNQKRRQFELFREQLHILRQLENWLEAPMFLLSLLWVLLLVVELVWGLNSFLQNVVTGIWMTFVMEFAIKYVVAPRKLQFLRKSWLTVFALLLPALRVFRIARVAYVLRAAPAVRGITLARLLTGFTRGLGSLRTTFGRFGFSYILMLTLMVTFLGAGGMYAFERVESGGALHSFGDALWFTAMLMTTSGSDYWPRTPEGRILCFLLALYAFAVFGYVTATLAALLLGQDRKVQPSVDTKADSLAELQQKVNLLLERLNTNATAPDAERQP